MARDSGLHRESPRANPCNPRLCRGFSHCLAGDKDAILAQASGNPRNPKGAIRVCVMGRTRACNCAWFTLTSEGSIRSRETRQRQNPARGTFSSLTMRTISKFALAFPKKRMSFSCSTTCLCKRRKYDCSAPVDGFKFVPFADPSRAHSSRTKDLMTFLQE